MGGYYPALAVQPPPDPTAGIERAVTLRNLIQNAPLELQQRQQAIQSGQLQIQQQQQQLKDQQATTQALLNWDGKDPNALGQDIAKRGGSANAVMGLQQHFLTLRDTASQIAQRDATTNQTNLKTILDKHDQYLGAINAAENVPDEQLHDHLAQTLDSLIPATADPQAMQFKQQTQQLLQSGIPAKQLRQQLDVQKAMLQGSKEQFEQAQTEAKTASEEASAKKTNIEIATPSPDERTSAIGTINTLSAIPQNQRAAFAKEVQGAATHAQLQDIQKRADSASESFQRSADARQQALSMKQLGISQLLVGQVNKLDEGLNTTLAGTAGVRQLLDMTKGGNEVASAAAQTRFAEHEIREGGINRMNQAELNSLTSNVGSYGRRIQAWASGGFQGQMPAATNNEMRLILEAEDKQATGLHDKQVQTVMSNYGQLTGGKGGTFKPQSTAPTPSGGGHSFTLNGQRYENVPDALYNKYRNQKGFSE